MSETDVNMAKRQDDALTLLAKSDVVCSAKTVEEAVTRLAREITEALGNRFPVVCCVMNGGVVLAGHLLSRLVFPLDFDYIDVSRYSDDNVGGSFSWRVKPKINLKNRTVLIVDDILDEGHTLALIKKQFLEVGAAAVHTAVLADKELGHSKPIVPDFVGITVPNRFVFGFGMDAYGYWRNLPAVYAINNNDKRGEHE